MVLRLDRSRVLFFLLGLQEVAPLIILRLALIVAVPLLRRVVRLLRVFLEGQHQLRHLLLRLDLVGLVRVEDVYGTARPLLSALVLVSELNWRYDLRMERGPTWAACAGDAAGAGDLFPEEQSAIIGRICIIVSTSYLIIDTDEIFARYFATCRYL